MHGVDDDIHVTAELGSFCFGCGDRKAMDESFRLLEGGDGRFTTKNMFRMLDAVVDIICWLFCVTRLCSIAGMLKSLNTCTVCCSGKALALLRFRFLKAKEEQWWL
jgi:hypothetical protein